MTLLLTWLNKSHAIQVSDRRVTTKGVLVDDQWNKVVVAQCWDGQFSIACTGIGYIGRQRTADWIVDCLDSLRGHRFTVSNCLKTLGWEAQAALKDARYDCPLTMAFAGWLNQKPVLGRISNFEGCPENSEGPVRTFYMQKGQLPGYRHNQNWLVSGQAGACAHGTQQLWRFAIKRLQKPERARALATVLARIIASASEHPSLGRYVSPNSMAVILPHGACKCYYNHFNQLKGVVGVSPHIIGPGFIFKNILSSDSGEMASIEWDVPSEAEMAALPRN